MQLVFVTTRCDSVTYVTSFICNQQGSLKLSCSCLVDSEISRKLHWTTNTWNITEWSVRENSWIQCGIKIIFVEWLFLNIWTNSGCSLIASEILIKIIPFHWLLKVVATETESTTISIATLFIIFARQQRCLTFVHF
jgi:hypothetical protein